MLAKLEHFQPPYRVLSAQGYILGSFRVMAEALAALRNWTQAVAVIQGQQVIARKPKATSNVSSIPPPRKRAG